VLKETMHPGQRLRTECLEQRGLTVTDAAKQLGVTRQALNNILNGKSGVSPQMAVRLAAFFGLRAEKIQQWQKDYELCKARSGRARRGRATSHSFLLSSNDLVTWAETLDARYALPLLIRALVRVTAKAAITVDFPAREDTQKPGWDGVVENPTRSAYVPKGTSVWELSTEARPQAKAERDYEKRTQNALGYHSRKATLVLVTLRRWPQKKEWAAAKEREGAWVRVVVLDATDIEQWLELAPEVAIWLATRMGRRPAGVQSLENFWSEFSASTAPPMKPALLLAGRKEQAAHVAKWLATGVGVLRVLADSSDEALAFIASVAANSPDPPIQCEMTDTIIVDDSEQVRQLMATPGPLTFAWRIADLSLLGSLIDKGHRALVPIGRSMAGAEHSDLELPRLTRAEFVLAIKDSLPGPDDEKKNEEANLRAWESGKSITVYRRRYAVAGVTTAPTWANAKDAGELIPVLLAGGWSESSDADRSVLSGLAGRDYADLSRLVVACSSQPDSPVRRIGDAWTLVAPLDAWSLLAKYITDIDLERFGKAITEVLGETDPALDMEPGNRWLAHVFDKQRRHSGSLRRGLADSLILLAVIGDRVGPRPTGTIKGFCDSVVATLLRGKSNGRRWSSLHDQLPALAEASPEPLLSALEDDLASADPGVMKLFEVEDRPLGGGARHPHLLWALEQLAWDPDKMSWAARILAKLTRLDPGGNLANGPKHSLAGIFCCWHPNTTAPLEERLKAIDGLVTRYPEVAWPLLLDLLPTQHGIGHTGAEPRWRAKPERPALTWDDLFRAYDAIIDRTLNMAGVSCVRLGKVMDRIGSWRPEQRARFVEQLSEFERTNTNSEERQTLWLEIRDFIGRSRTYRFMEDTELKPLEDVFERLASASLLDKHAWLFEEDFPDLTSPQTTSTTERLSIEARMEELDLARRLAMTDIIGELGVDGIVALASRVKLSGAVGFAAADTLPAGSVEHEVLDRTLASSDPKIVDAGVCFVYRRGKICGVHWYSQILLSNAFTLWPTAKQAAFCLGLPVEESTWRTVASLGPDVEREYWLRTTVFLIQLSRHEDAEYAVTKLLDVGRAPEALDQAGFHPDKLSARLLVRVLDDAVGELAKLKTLHLGTVDHNIERVLTRLRSESDLSSNELGRLEWQYLPLLHHFHRPVTLDKALQDNPELFAEVLAHAYKPDEAEGTPTEEEGESDDTARKRARLAWELLSKWNSVPGADSGEINADIMRSWVARARTACSASGRSRIGDIEIGRILSYAFPASDGIWPPAEVRDLIEDLESHDLESGLHSGRVNQRGVWTKSLADGGRPERELAKQYRTAAKKLAAHWQRTARLLNSLADTYESFGRHDDISAERMDLL
jgi:addiction module HigA family antidote